MVTSEPALKKRDVELSIRGVPPVKQPSIGNHRDNRKRRIALRTEALRIAKSKPYVF